MATMTVQVTSNPIRTDLPSAGPIDVTICQTTRVINIPVPAGQSRYITEVYSPGAIGGTSQTYTVTTNTTVTLTLDGQINDQFPAENNFYSAYCRVSLGPTEPFIFTSGITRECDTNQIC